MSLAGFHRTNPHPSAGHCSPGPRSGSCGSAGSGTGAAPTQPSGIRACEQGAHFFCAPSPVARSETLGLQSALRGFFPSSLPLFFSSFFSHFFHFLLLFPFFLFPLFRFHFPPFLLLLLSLSLFFQSLRRTLKGPVPSSSAVQTHPSLSRASGSPIAATHERCPRQLRFPRGPLGAHTASHAWDVSPRGAP